MVHPDEMTREPADAFDDVHIDLDVADLTALFLHAKNAEVRSLFDALEQRDFRRLRQVGHNLTGSGGAYGFPRLSALGAALAQSARSENAAAALDQLSALASYLAAWTRRYG